MKNSDEMRFFEKVDKLTEGECWEWKASIRKDGYGRFRVDGKTILAHRYAYKLHTGIYDNSIELDHICNNRRCVNPAHLRPCSRIENSRNRLSTREFKGVSWHKRICKWQAQIKINNCNKSLGYFQTPQDAHEAYKRAALEAFGEFVNFGKHLGETA